MHYDNKKRVCESYCMVIEKTKIMKNKKIIEEFKCIKHKSTIIVNHNQILKKKNNNYIFKMLKYYYLHAL